MIKPAFSYEKKTKVQISCGINVQLNSTFVFATRIVQSLYFPNPKFQASSHFHFLYSLICVRPEDRFSRDTAQMRRTLSDY